MINQSFIVQNALAQIIVLMIFFLVIVVEIMTFLIFDNSEIVDKDKSIDIINRTAYITKLIHIIIGFLNFFIFLFISVFYSLYFYFLWLKFRYSGEYDKLQKINYYSLIIFSFLNYFILFFDSFFAPDIITFNFIILAFSISFFPYISYKRKAINYRNKAIEALREKNYELGLNFLSEGILNAKKMLTRFNFLGERPSPQSKLGKMMELEYSNLKLLNPRDLIINQEFKIPKIPRSDIRKYLLLLIIPFIVLYLPLYLFRI